MARYGSLKRMGDLAERLEELASVPSRASRAAAERINEELAVQFSEGVDPYGSPWAPLAPRTLLKHGPPALTETGAMSDGTYAAPRAGAGIDITVPFPGGIHQTGAKRGAWSMPARHILPQGSRLPDAWKEAIDDALREAFGA